MADLSSAAQAIINAAVEGGGGYGRATPVLHARIAAALRAAADQVVPFAEIVFQEDLESRREAMVWGMQQQTQLIRQQFLAIATELEAQ